MKKILILLLLGSVLGFVDHGNEDQIVPYKVPISTYPQYKIHHLIVQTNINGWHNEWEQGDIGYVRAPRKHVPYRIRVIGVFMLETRAPILGNLDHKIVNLVSSQPSNPVTIEPYTEEKKREENHPL